MDITEIVKSKPTPASRVALELRLEAERLIWAKLAADLAHPDDDEVTDSLHDELEKVTSEINALEANSLDALRAKAVIGYWWAKTSNAPIATVDTDAAQAFDSLAAAFLGTFKDRLDGYYELAFASTEVALVWAQRESSNAQHRLVG